MLPVFTWTSTCESCGDCPTSIVPLNSVNCPRTLDSMCRATNPTTVWVWSSSYLPAGGIDTPSYSRPCSAVCAISFLLLSGPRLCGRTSVLIDVRPVEHRRLPVRPPRHKHAPSAGDGVCHCEL